MKNLSKEFLINLQGGSGIEDTIEGVCDAVAITSAVGFVGAVFSKAIRTAAGGPIGWVLLTIDVSCAVYNYSKHHR